MKKYEFLKHTADVKFAAYGKTKEEMFSNSLFALVKIITDKKIKPEKRIKINVKATSLESLLYKFLEEFVFLIDAKNLVLAEIKSLKIKGNLLEAEVLVGKFSDYEQSNEVKAITYNSMKVNQDKKGFSCEVVVDV